MLGNKDEPDDAVVVGAPLVAVVVAPVVAAVLAGAAGLAKLKPPPADAPVEAAGGENRLGVAEADDAALFPPRFRPEAGLDEGWDEAGCAGVAPTLNPPKGFAGVDEGVVLPSPPNRLPAGAVVLFASFEAPEVPPRLKPPEGLVADCPGVLPNKPGVEDDVVAAGFAPPNKDEPPLAWLF
jgi:hypothetical protein